MCFDLNKKNVLINLRDEKQLIINIIQNKLIMFFIEAYMDISIMYSSLTDILPLMF